MDPFRRNPSLNSQSNLHGSEQKRRKNSGNKVTETDENGFPSLHNGTPTKSQDLKTELMKNALFSNTTTSSFKKKILAERKEDLLPDSSLSSYLEITPQSKYVPCANPSGASIHNSPISLHSYDPITNYTSPRPKFLRYNPNQRRELLQRIEVGKRENEEVRSASSPSPNSSTKREDDNEDDNEEEEELEEEEKPWWYSCEAWSLLLIFGVLVFISYCMSSSSRPSLGVENPATNVLKIREKTPLRSVGKSFFPGIFLESLSQMCPIVRESLCELDENLFVSHQIDRSIGRERSGERESFMEGIRSEFSDKTEVVVAEDHDLVLKNGGGETVVKEQMEDGDQKQRDSGPLAEAGNTNKSTSRVMARSSVEPVQISLSQEISDRSSTIREDEFHNENFDSMEFPSTSSSRVDGLEDFNFTLASDTKLKSYLSSNILPERALRTFSIFLGSLTILVGLLSCFHKCFQRSTFNSFRSPPSSKFCVKTETREKIALMKEESLDKALDISVQSNSSRLNVVPSPLDHMNVEFKELSGFGPPSVELLGEFSLIDAEATNNGFGKNLKTMEYPNSQFSYYQKGRAREMLSPFPDLLVSSPEESASTRFSSKVPADKGERSDTSTTSSLRRSSRLRNRNRVICP